jgi:hypothetical protein
VLDDIRIPYVRLLIFVWLGRFSPGEGRRSEDVTRSLDPAQVGRAEDRTSDRKKSRRKKSFSLIAK